MLQKKKEKKHALDGTSVVALFFGTLRKSVISYNNSMWVSMCILSYSRNRLFTSDLLRYVDISLEKCSFRVFCSASSALLWKDHVFDCSPDKVEVNVVETNVIDKISVPRKESKLYPLIVKVYKSLSWEVAREMGFFNAVNRYGYPHSIYAFRIIAHVFALAAMEMEVHALLRDIANYNREAKMDMYELFPSLLDSHEHAWRSAIVCAELMKVFVFDAMVENAMDVFVQMKKFGFKPNIKSCNFLLMLLVEANRLNFVRCFFEELKNYGPSPNVYTYTIMMNFYFKGHPERAVDILQATDLFEDMERNGVSPTVVTYGTYIHGLCRVDCVESAMKFIRSLIQENQPVNTYFYNSVIHGFCQKGEVHEALNVLEEMKNHGISADVYTYSILIDGFGKNGDIENALRMIKEMELCNIKPSLVSYCSLLHGFCKSGLMDIALNLFRDLGASGYEYDTIAYSILINGYCMQGHLENVLELINEMKELKAEIKLDVITYTTIINMFCHMNKMVEACGFFEEMTEKGLIPNTISYTTLIAGFSRTGDMKKAWALFNLMQQRGCSPDVVTYNCLIDGFCKSQCMDLASLLVDEMNKNNITPNVVTYNCLIDGFCKSQRMDLARLLVDEMNRNNITPNVVTYNCLIDGFCKSQRMDLASLLVDEMIRNNITPNVVIFTTLMAGYRRLGDFEKAHNLFIEMKKEGYSAR